MTDSPASDQTTVADALHKAILAAVSEAGDVDISLAISTFLRAMHKDDLAKAVEDQADVRQNQELGRRPAIKKGKT